MPHELPPSGDEKSIWKIIELTKLYGHTRVRNGHPDPREVVRDIGSVSLRRVDMMLSTAVC